MPKSLMDNELNAVTGGAGTQQKDFAQEIKDLILKKIQSGTCNVICPHCKQRFTSMMIKGIVVKSGTKVDITCSCRETNTFDVKNFD